MLFFSDGLFMELIHKNDNSVVMKGRTNYVLHGLWRWSILNSVGIIGT